MGALTQWIISNWEFVTVSGVAALSIMLNIIVFMLTPAGTFLKTTIRGGMNLVVIRKDKKAHIVNARVKGGMAETKRYGSFIIVMKTILNLIKGGTIGIAVEDTAFTVDKDVTILTQVLAERGFNNMEEVLELFNTYGDKHIVNELKRGLNERPIEEEINRQGETGEDKGIGAEDSGKASESIAENKH